MRRMYCKGPYYVQHVWFAEPKEKKYKDIVSHAKVSKNSSAYIQLIPGDHGLALKHSRTENNIHLLFEAILHEAL